MCEAIWRLSGLVTKLAIGLLPTSFIEYFFDIRNTAADKNLINDKIRQSSPADLFISRKVLGRDAEEGEAPVILDEYANTSSAGSIIAFHKYNEDFE